MNVDIGFLNKTSIKHLKVLYKTAVNSYYGGKKLTLTDAQFDLLEKHLMCNGVDTEQIKMNIKKCKVKHMVPMLSVMRFDFIDELKSYLFKVLKQYPTSTLVVECKYDGVAASVVYENGKLKHVATRGSYTHGDCITRHADAINGIPKTIPVKSRYEIRGEVCVPKSTVDVEEYEYRRLAASSIRSKSSKKCKDNHLFFTPYMVISDTEPKSHIVRIVNAVKYGFRKPELLIKATLEQVEDVISGLKDSKDNFSTVLDGLIVKACDDEVVDKLPSTQSKYGHMWAFKFPSLTHRVKVNNIVYSVSDNGFVTPVLLITPVVDKGITISKINLSNTSKLKSLGVVEGSTILVKLAGGVIPVIAGVEDKTHDLKLIEMCPRCGSKLIMDNKDSYLMCPNKKHK